MACVNNSIDSLIAVLAIALDSNPSSKILGLVAYAWTYLGAAFGPLIILSLLWKCMTLKRRDCWYYYWGCDSHFIEKHPGQHGTV